MSNGATEIVSSGGTTSGTILGGHETVLRGGRASSTTVLSSGYEFVSSGGTTIFLHDLDILP